MAFIDVRKKNVQAKIVYYGPGRSGKTTNIEYLFSKFRDKTKSDIVSIATHGDRTLYFDYIPLNLGRINGYDLTIQLYTVPGQVKYESTRKLVLRGVDGIVFVADSLEVRRNHNKISLQSLHENLKSYNKSIFNIPLLIQFNKRDLENHGYTVLAAEVMNKELNSRLKAPVIEASAVTGHNVVNTLKKIIALTQAEIKTSFQ